MPGRSGCAEDGQDGCAGGTASGMTTSPSQPDSPIEEVRPDPDVPPRPEEEVADAARQPAAGGDLGGEPAQGEGAADSY